ncbi:MAG: TRAP transporter substrate-binding protein [Candidatus Schekmanbacteria bacterium]|nr:TRAP transporter substrate-binding protein [Candidatus Schekmanbacteria bacterium]
MKRREFMQKAAATLVVTGAAVACGPGPAGEHGAPAVHAAKNVMWKLASSFPRGLDTIYGGAEALAQRVDAMTGGSFKIRCYPAGEIVPALAVLDAVQQETVQIGHTASYYYTGKNPVLAFDTAVPFGLTARQQAAWMAYGGGRELLQPVFADFGIISFSGGNTGAQMGGWFRREVGEVADLQGLKMRIPGLGGDVMSRLGATVQVLAGGDIYPALERGAIDATEWVGPYDDEKLGFHKVAKYYYYPGWWEPGPALSFYVNRKAWDSLPKIYQEVFVAATAEANLGMLANYDAKNPPAMARLRAAGVELRPFSDSILAAAYREAEALLGEQAAADAAYGKVYDAWRKFRAESHRWFATAEAAFAAFTFPRAAEP